MSLARGSRQGFSLLEVILSLAILAGAIATIGELSRLGMRNAEYARDMTQALLLCQSKLAEISSGLSAAESQQDEPITAAGEEEDSTEAEWLCTVEVGADEAGSLVTDVIEGLVPVKVTVTRNLPSERYPAKVSLVRWIAESGGSS